VIKLIVVLQSIALFLLSVYFLLLLLASGHRIDFDDSSQLKFIVEMVIFLTAIYLLVRGKNLQQQFKWVVVILLILVQLSFLDFYFEILSVEYDNNPPITFFILFSLLFVSNLYLIYLQFKALIKNRETAKE